jgi:hypothetical protein
VEYLFEAVFSVRSVPRITNEDQLPESLFIGNTCILSSEMLHKDYDRKGSFVKKSLIVSLKGFGAKTN